MAIKKISIIVNDQNGKINESSINNSARTAVNKRRAKDRANNYIGEVLNTRTREQYFVVDDNLKAKLKESSNILKLDSIKRNDIPDLISEVRVIELIQEQITSLQGVKGDKGDKGDVGETGPQGIQGPKGEQGLQGIQGERGPQGEKGDRGEKGEQGLQGERGPAGEKGEKGDRGDTGPKGDKGDQGEQGIQGIQGIQGLKGEKGDKGDPGDIPSLKTINGESLIGEGDIVIQSVDTSSLETELAEVRVSNNTLSSKITELTTKMGKLYQVFPDSYLDELLLWRPANTAQWSNVFGGSSVGVGDVIRFNNQKSCFLAPENVIGIKFKLRAPNNPGQYILWVISSVNRSNQSDVRAFTMDFTTYVQDTYLSWIKPREGHTAYNNHHGATVQNIKDVFNAHNLEITVLIEDGKIKCSNTLGFRFEVNAYAFAGGFVNRLGLGSQANFSNNAEAYDIKVLTA